ncbi:hypothetical protein [Fictibacillus barbaricus]|uniref:5-bromo-4-chloroindolyl phosphate hydrolysis protein n=1 Tax=Fictibacillus barbaricus TaxID=182136 RepID=A0ABS2ZJB1_9BACL|nr:hypothetical protein [Fictibacillus barbaricus]MBN3546694.1 hypothetical protein [Fictibacillus barbaricus]GGB43078.1 hypothetical protein GCM10007199_05480 [Fictibacillus barbaricus]
MNISEIISQMKPADYIALGVGLGTILSTFFGVWLGAYLSGRYAAKQAHKVNHLSSQILGIRSSAKPLSRKMEESRNLFNAVGEVVDLFKDKSEEEIEQIDKFTLEALNRKIDYCTELVCNFYETELPTHAQRLLVRLQVESKNIPNLYNLIAFEKDISIRGHAWDALNTCTQNISSILKKMDNELEKVEKQLEDKEKILNQIL